MLSAAVYGPIGLVTDRNLKTCSWAAQPSRRTCKKCAKRLSSLRFGTYLTCHHKEDQHATYPWSVCLLEHHQAAGLQLARGKRLAVYVAVNIEQFSYNEGKGAGIAPPEQSNTHSIFSWRDYGNRVGIWRLFELFDELDIPAEAQMNTAIYEHCPDIPQKLRERGDEILGHGITNSEEQGHLDEKAEAELIQTATETIQRHEGQRPVGWMSPWLSNSEVTADLLQEAGYRYFMDWTCDDQPIWMKTRNGRILAMPYPIETNDNRAIVWFRYTSSELADMLHRYLRRDARAIGTPAARVSDLLTSLRDGTTLPHSSVTAGVSAYPAPSGAYLAHSPTRHLRLYRESPGGNRARELRAGDLRLTDAPGSGIRNRLQPHINPIALSPIPGDWMAHDTMRTLRRTHLAVFLGRRSGSC